MKLFAAIFPGNWKICRIFRRSLAKMLQELRSRPSGTAGTTVCDVRRNAGNAWVQSSLPLFLL